MKLSESYFDNLESYRLLVDSVKDYAIFMLDPQGIVASWNIGAQRIKGYTAQEIIGQHFSRFYTDEDNALHLPDQELVLATREGKWEGEGWRVKKMARASGQAWSLPACGGRGSSSDSPKSPAT